MQRCMGTQRLGAFIILHSVAASSVSEHCSLLPECCSPLASCRERVAQHYTPVEPPCTPPPTTTHRRYTSSHRRPWSCPKLAPYTRIYLWEENKANGCGLYFPVEIFAETLGFGRAEISATIQESYVALGGGKGHAGGGCCLMVPTSML